MKSSAIIIHSQQGKDRHDAFDFPAAADGMDIQHVHYDYFGEMVGDRPIIVRQWPVNVGGAHARGWNGWTGSRGRAIGFAFAGDGRIECPPNILLIEMAEYIREARDAYGIPLDRIWLHRDAPGANTDCPGEVFVARAWPRLQAML